MRPTTFHKTARRIFLNERISLQPACKRQCQHNRKSLLEASENSMGKCCLIAAEGRKVLLHVLVGATRYMYSDVRV